MRLIRICLAGVLLAGASSSIARADDLFAVDEATNTEPAPQPDESPPEVPVVCHTREVPYQRSERGELGGMSYVYIEGRYYRFDLATGQGWVRSRRTCRRGDEVVSSDLIWETVNDPDPAVVASILRDRQAKEIAPPAPLLSPVGPGVVNLGMWLAVADPGPYVVTASARPGSWVTARADLAETMFDMGNGDVVVCSGAGDPIPTDALDSTLESPVCGYTYTELNDGRPYTISVTSTWNVTWTSSRGTGGNEAPIVKSTSLDYEVLEIQTVGGPLDD
jgi:hypothetical protein